MKSKKIIPSLIVFFLLLVITFLVYKNLLRQDSQEIDSVITEEKNNITSAILEKSNLYTTVLRSGIGFLNSSNNVTRSDWKSFIDTLDLETNYPGIQGVGYSKIISSEQKENHIQSIRNEGFPDYSIKPDTEKEEYTSIIYLEPFDKRNREAFGLDMTFEINRRTAMYSARDSGKPKMSGRVTLVQEIDEDVQAGFLIYYPHYTNASTDLNTISERRSSIEGYVYSPFRMRDFMKGILANQNFLLDFAIYDGGIDNIGKDEYFMYSSLEKINLDSRYKSEISIAGNKWGIIFNPKNRLLNLVNNSLENFVLVFGFIISFLIAFVVYLLNKSRFKAISKLREKTDQLQKTRLKVRQTKNKIEIDEEKTKAILSSIGDALFVTDSFGKIILVNDMFQKITGWEKEEVLGLDAFSILKMSNTTGELIPKSERPLTKALQNKKINKSKLKDIQYPRKDGTFFPTAITVSPILIKDKIVGAVEVFRDITEEYRIEKAKDEFITLTSHQLRTPLTTIKWYSEALINDEKLTKKDRDIYTKEIHSGTIRMSKVVDGILNTANMQVGKFNLNPEYIDFHNLIQEIIEDSRGIIKNKDLSINVNIDKETAKYKFDKKTCSIILQNLLSNSFKYTDEGFVSIKIYIKNNFLRIEISDSGHGIQLNQQENIFNKFFRADNIKSKDTTGTGVGLYTIKMILDKIGGNIDFNSIENKGTNFIITIPMF